MSFSPVSRRHRRTGRGVANAVSPPHGRATAARRAAAGVLLAAAAGIACAPVLAAPVNWNGERFAYATNGSSVADTLRTFAAGQHLALRISGTLGGEVSGRFAMPPQRFLDMLCATYGLVWYFDGAVLRVSPAGAQQPLAMRPHYLTPDALRAALLGAGVADEHFPLRADAAAGTLSVYGPPDYVASVRQAAARLEGDARSRTHTAVRLFHLRVATAADQTRVIDGREVVVPGVATLLRQRLHGGGRATPNDAATSAAANAPLEFDAPLPVVEADAGTNSILIRDVPDRIDGDGVLVADADVRPQLVALQTWVVDVPADALPDVQSALSAPLTPHAPVTAADGARALLDRLAALERTRGARLEVSRTAFTLDSAPAVFDRHEAQLLTRTADADGDDDGDALDDSSSGVDVWLSVAPTVETGSGVPGVSLRVDWTRPEPADGAHDGARHGASASVPAGDGLAVLVDGAPASMRRVIVVVPRIVA
ncbi:MAG TPA: type II/III secretion system family protein [Paraburkholderia sp.]|jgi:type III secretion protein C|nr:type II/III secretion system family protein [Paraburkholderia sp.]